MKYPKFSHGAICMALLSSVTGCALDVSESESENESEDIGEQADALKPKPVRLQNLSSYACLAITGYWSGKTSIGLKGCASKEDKQPYNRQLWVVKSDGTVCAAEENLKTFNDHMTGKPICLYSSDYKVEANAYVDPLPPAKGLVKYNEQTKQLKGLGYKNAWNELLDCGGHVGNSLRFTKCGPNNSKWRKI